VPIRLLPADVALKIAAGEVVTRPTDAVKELVENSIDALVSAGQAGDGTSGGRVDVEIRDGGLALIRVSDNGPGIQPDELPLAFERHATSKLRAESDLYSLGTLGFRGEALPSIAAISRLTMVSRTYDRDAGAAVELEFGVIVSQGARGTAPGTTVAVHALFHNVPARLRFLRSTAGESTRIVAMIGQLAMAYPEVAFSVVSEGRLALQTAGTGSLRDAMLKVHDLNTVSKMVPVAHSAGRVTVRGLAAPPEATRGSRSGLSVFVNRRLVQNRALVHAVEDAYRPALLPGRHPVAAVLLGVPPEQVDVNVHPTKSEVRFADERAIYAAVNRAVREALHVASPVPAVTSRLVSFAGPERQASWLRNTEDGQSAAHRAEPRASPEDGSPAESARPPASPSARNVLPILHPLGQVQKTYIVAEGPDGVYFIDQHTAHERIRYEALRARRELGPMESQRLLAPIPIDLDEGQVPRASEHSDGIRRLGFEWSAVSSTMLLLEAVPAILRPTADHRQAFLDVLESVDGPEPAPGIDPALATMACHTAVRAGDELSSAEMRALLTELETLDILHYCPHGRPIVIRLDAGQIARDFGRT
jgi:DNA mismatch repair protein MutL